MYSDKDKYLEAMLSIPVDDYSNSINALCQFMEEQAKLKLHIDEINNQVYYTEWYNLGDL